MTRSGGADGENYGEPVALDGARPAAVGLVLVLALAALVAVIAATGSTPVAAPPSLEASPSSGGPCEDPSGICLAPDVCPAPTRTFSAAELAQVRPSVESMIGNAFYGIGTGERSIEADLFPGHEALAAELEHRFGDAVTVRIGTTRYCHGFGRSARCADAQGATAPPRGLHLRLTLDDDTLQGTEAAGAGVLHVRYDGPATFTLDLGQPIVANLVQPRTRTVVGTFTGDIAGTGLNLVLAAGQESSIRVIVGISRCDGELGSALPPGHYGVRAPLGPDGGSPRYLAPEVALTIL